MKKILFSAQIILFSAALPLYAYVELSQGANKSEPENAIQSGSVAIAPTATPMTEHSIKFPGKANKTIAKPGSKTTEAIAKATVNKTTLQKKQTVTNITDTEEAMIPQYPEWRISPVGMTGNIAEDELTAKIMKELRTAFEKDIRSTMHKLKVKRVKCENKREICTCISL